jgi:tripartite-type tricarboxylate transporter receptor subunit TctC
MIVYRKQPWHLLVAALVLTSPAAAQSNYPDRPIRVVVLGGMPNIAARVITQKMSETMGRPIVVEIIPGASGSVAAERVARSAPDGYTILISGDAAMTTNVSLYKKLSYDPLKDFVPITLAVDSTNILAVHPSVPVNDVQELVALAKKQPGKLSFGSGGNGTSQHLGGELLKSRASIDLSHVPYRDGTQVLPDLLSGRISMQFGNISSLLPLVREGKLRGIAVTSLKRAQQIPDMPTIAESGFPGFEATAWAGMLAPTGTPDAIVRRLHQETLAAMQAPDVRNRLVELGFTIVGSSGEDFAAQIKAEIERKGKLVRASGAAPI